RPLHPVTTIYAIYLLLTQCQKRTRPTDRLFENAVSRSLRLFLSRSGAGQVSGTRSRGRNHDTGERRCDDRRERNGGTALGAGAPEESEGLAAAADLRAADPDPPAGADPPPKAAGAAEFFLGRDLLGRLRHAGDTDRP